MGALLSIATARAEVVVNEDEFRDWIGRCETETTTGEVICFIYTGRVAEVEGESLAARIVVGIGDNMAPIVYLDVPDTAEPANGFMLRVDQREPFSGMFSNCSTGWCHTEAGGEVAEALIAQFRAGSQATASFILEGEEVQVDMPLSLLGFTAAYTQLVQIHAQAAEATAADQEEALEEVEQQPQDEAEEAPAEPVEDDPATEEGAADEEATEEDTAPEDTAPEDGTPEDAAPGEGTSGPDEQSEQPEAPAAPEEPAGDAAPAGGAGEPAGQ